MGASGIHQTPLHIRAMLSRLTIHPSGPQRMDRRTELRRRLAGQFPIRDFPVNSGGRRFDITSAEDIDTLIEHMTLEEFNRDEKLPYWADIWHSAVALGDFLQQYPHTIAGKHILDLGCGLGLEGLVASRYAGSVTFADYDSNALIAAELNALQNGCAGQLEYVHLDFRNPPHKQWQVVIAADIIYEDRFTEPLLSFLDRATGGDGMIIIAEPNRTVAERFFAALKYSGFRIRSFNRTGVLHGRAVDVAIHCAARSESGLERLLME